MMLEFVIMGDPFGKQNMRPMNINGHASAFNPSSNVNYMNRVIDIVTVELSKRPLWVKFSKREPISIIITAYYKIPQSNYKYYKKTNETKLNKEGEKMLAGEILPTKKPDLDNISKIVCDAITKQGNVWEDDSQIVNCLLMKRYSERPRVEVIIESWGIKHEQKL